MSNNYVKKYDVGNLYLDLPYANCIYELPLLTFGDMRNTVNLSLIFNHKLKEDGDNSFNMTAGYKLNLQKRIFLNNENTAYYQEANGKIEQLFSDTNSNGICTFDDDSQRIIFSQSSGEYLLEYPDFSKEKYDSSGRITETIDKYGDRLLTYVYTGNLLTSIVFRPDSAGTEHKTVTLGYNSSSRDRKSVV